MIALTLPRKKNNPETLRRRKERLKRLGLCINCAARPAGRRNLCTRCLDLANAACRALYRKRKASSLCPKCRLPLPSNKSQCAKCLQRQIDRARLRRKETKLFVVGWFGGKCGDCAETDIRTLSLDHVDNDGAAHRRLLNGTIRVWKHVEKEIKALGKPSHNLQLLCLNCHAKKTWERWQW